MVLPPSFIVINQYFKERRSVAFAVSTLGMGLGALCAVPLLGYWFQLYGYIGALLLNAGMCLHIQVAGALMRPPAALHKDGGHALNMDVHGCQGDEEIPVVNKQKQMASKLELLRNLSFSLYLFNIWTSVLASVISFLPAFGLEIGVSTTRSSWIVSMSGLADIVGRVLSGLVFNNIKHGCKGMYHSCVGILNGSLLLSVGFVDTYVSLSIMIFFIAICEAVFSAQRMEVLFEFVPKASMSNAVGMLLFSEMVGMLLSPVMHGLIYAKYTTYSIGFAIGGSLFVCTSLLMFIRVKYYTKVTEPGEERNHTG